MANTEHDEVMYKTTTCRSFATSGTCPYGYKCVFAHGVDELRTVNDNEQLQVHGASPRQVLNFNGSMFSQQQHRRHQSMQPLASSSSSSLSMNPTSSSTAMRAYSIATSSSSSSSSLSSPMSSPGTARHSTTPLRSTVNSALVAQSAARRSRAFFPADGIPKHLLAPAYRQRAHTLHSLPLMQDSPSMSSRAVLTPSQSLSLRTSSMVAPSPRKWSSSSTTAAAAAAAAASAASSPLSLMSMSSPMVKDTSSPMSSTKSPQAMEHAKKLYKTELCRSWQESNMCPYGVKCQFAHGQYDLRIVERHRKYKTERCNKFHSQGVCPFGSRCVFVHEEDTQEAVNTPSNNAVMAAHLRTSRRLSLGGTGSMSPMALASPAGIASARRRFNRFGDEHKPVDDFIKRRMTGDASNAMANLSLKDTAKRVNAVNVSCVNDEGTSGAVTTTTPDVVAAAPTATTA